MSQPDPDDYRKTGARGASRYSRRLSDKILIARGNTPPAEPILRDFHNIREADALLSYEREEPQRDKSGHLATRVG